MQDKISIIDAGLACHDGAPAYFEIEYRHGQAIGTARVSLETCFDALNEGNWERWEDGTVRLEAEAWNEAAGRFEMRRHNMTLRAWVENRLFGDGFFYSARTIISHLNTLNHESNNVLL